MFPMRERIRKRKRGLSLLAKPLIGAAIGQREDASDQPRKNSAAVWLARLGRLEGGEAWASGLLVVQRSAIARKATLARYCSQ